LKKIVYLLSVSFVFLSASIVSAQSIHIKKAIGKIKLDALIDEPDWQSAEVADNFQQYFPTDTAKAKSKTEVRMTYDDQFIYISAKMYNLKNTREYVTPSLRRDFRGEGNDGITFVFDTFKDRTNGFIFGVNPFGVQREGLVSNGGDDFSLDWDNKWYSHAEQFDGYWAMEAAIPFTTLRFKEGLDSWYVNFYRIDSENAERSTWSPIPLNFDIVSLAFSKELVWDKPLEHPGTNISIIPYVAGLTSKDFEAGKKQVTDFNIGGDAKIAIGPALNLDLTVNPDFSQVEVDQQVTNLDRFEIFFPERRQFFLENADLFANFGFGDATPFFSRRIGVSVNKNTGQNFQNTIYAGARLSGKINNNVRVGFLTMQTGEDKAQELPTTNYTAATLQYKVFSRSNIGLIFVNKQAQQDSIGGDFTLNPNVYNRVVGIDYNLQSKNNVWFGKAFYHRSFQQNKPDSAFTTGAFLSYTTQEWEAEIYGRATGANYNPAVGFVRRRDIKEFGGEVRHNFYPVYGDIRNHGPGIDGSYISNERFGTLDWDLSLRYRIAWKSTARFEISPIRFDYTFLFDSFDPSGDNGLELAAGTGYRNISFNWEYLSDQRSKLFYILNGRYGEYFNGKLLNLEGSLSYRFQPYGFVSLDFQYNNINLPKPYKSTDLILVSPRIDLTFTKNLFWTTFVQFNSQNDNLNINSRLQWRFAPVSDFFLVYTDNYFTSNFTNPNTQQFFERWQPRQRAIVFKLTYWLNL
jgi:hypothetical protein